VVAEYSVERTNCLAGTAVLLAFLNPCSTCESFLFLACTADLGLFFTVLFFVGTLVAFFFAFFAFFVFFFLGLAEVLDSDYLSAIEPLSSIAGKVSASVVYCTTRGPAPLYIGGKCPSGV